MINKWDKRFLRLAVEISAWSTCYKDYGHVGAVLIKDRRVIAAGYNGAPEGVETCKERGYCYKRCAGMEHGPAKCYAVHAEQNALVQAARLGISVEGATLYCTHKPCEICTKLILNSGIKRVVYINDYQDEFADLLMSYDKDFEIEQYKGDLDVD